MYVYMYVYITRKIQRVLSTLRLCNYVSISCTVSEITSLICQNLKKSRNHEHIPFGRNLSYMH